MQRPGPAASGLQGVERGGLGTRIRRQRQHAVDRQPLGGGLIEPGDSVEVGIDQLCAGQRASAQRRVGIADAGFQQLEARRGLAAGAGRGRAVAAGDQTRQREQGKSGVQAVHRNAIERWQGECRQESQGPRQP